ncbi:hypothetical protein [Erwinia mallotivora]|uniref:hypothetical protein n=1 Tax=Erwinia mallotivora TaxID=69222 RepID=UPI0021BE627D|nr:hypothetical protein [Erwinia mallotivora]
MLISKTLSLLLLLGFISSSAFAEVITIWREPAPVLKEGKYKSLILDRGQLTKALPDSKNEYIFTEKGAGVKPLVLVGTYIQIVEFLKKYETRGIESQIDGLNKIYMGVANYHPRERFISIWHPGNILVMAVENIQKFLPFGNDITDVAGVAGDLKELYEKIDQLDEKQKSSGSVMYVKFSYLPEDGMTEIGNKKITFGAVLNEMQKMAKH